MGFGSHIYGCSCACSQENNQYLATAQMPIHQVKRILRERPNLATPKSVIKHTAKIILNAILTYRKQVFKILCIKNTDGSLGLSKMATEVMFKEHI